MVLDFNDAPRQATEPATAPVWAEGSYSRDDVLARLRAHLEGVLGYLYPNGFADPKGRKFYIGSINGEPGESLSIELQGEKAGLWHDFATGEGGDIFDLWQAARGLAGFRETLKDAGEYAGATATIPRRTPKRKSPKGGEAWGAPTHVYKYQDPTGKLIAEVERFEWEDNGERKKTFRPWDVSTRSYQAPQTRPLYNLPNIVSAPEIIVCEGEKAADALIAQNIDATTAMGGSNAPLEKTDWTPLRGRKVVIWPDNDATGRAYAERLKVHLEGQGALAVSILNVPTSRPDKWDAADAADEDLGALIRSMRSEAAAMKQRNSRFFSAADLDGIEPPPRRWHVADFIPAHQVTMLGGDGGVGKSLVALQLAVASALGTRWVGMVPEKTRTVYITAEDDQDEVHRRLDDITAAQGVSLGSLDDLLIRSLAGEDALLAVADSRSGTLSPTDLFRELDEYIAQTGAGFLVLDTLADLHSGEENNRAVARQFISLLRGLALRRECTVLLLAHPSLTGMQSGSGLSGSTAWNNSVRSRLYIERIKEDGEELDPDLRRLTTKKANYSTTGQGIVLRWQDGVFVPEANGSPADGLLSTPDARAKFLDLLDKFKTEGRKVNATSGRNFAPTVMAKDPRSGKWNKTALHAAMTDLFTLGAIVTAPYGKPSDNTNEIVRKENVL